MDILDLFKKGGPAMWPLLVLSVLSLSVIFERLWFWLRILAQEKEIVNRVIDAAGEDWGIAEAMAEQAIKQPVGRFLYAPLSLQKADPETCDCPFTTVRIIGDSFRFDSFFRCNSYW